MKPHMYRLHEDLENWHWWFVARRQIVLSLLRRHVTVRPARLLDAGCGMGGLLPHLAELGEAAGMDPSQQAVDRARAQSGADVRLGSLPDEVPADFGSFDAITLLDVLEHIDDDVAAARTLASLLRPNGLLVVTVPAYMFLWSEHDRLNEHRRRYTDGELRDVLQRAGLRLRFISYYNTLLFPGIAAVRLASRLRDSRRPPTVGVVPSLINRVLRALFASERWLLRIGRLPFGVSLIAVAERLPQPVSLATGESAGAVRTSLLSSTGSPP